MTKRLTDDQLARLSAVHEAASGNGDWPDYEYVGRPYMQERQLTKESLDFYCAAMAAVPHAIAELRSHRAADLTDEERGHLEFAVHCVNHSLTQMKMSPGGHGLSDVIRHQDVLSVLSKLLAGKERG